MAVRSVAHSGPGVYIAVQSVIQSTTRQRNPAFGGKSGCLASLHGDERRAMQHVARQLPPSHSFSQRPVWREPELGYAVRALPGAPYRSLAHAMPLRCAIISPRAGRIGIHGFVDNVSSLDLRHLQVFGYLTAK
jgi:hypothetical protein